MHGVTATTKNDSLTWMKEENQFEYILQKSQVFGKEQQQWGTDKMSQRKEHPTWVHLNLADACSRKPYRLKKSCKQINDLLIFSFPKNMNIFISIKLFINAKHIYGMKNIHLMLNGKALIKILDN